MKRGIMLLLLALLVFTLFHLAYAQQPAKIPRIGYVSGTGDATNQGPYVEAFAPGVARSWLR